MTALLLYFVLGVAVSLPCCFIVPKLLARNGYLDIPGERSSHVRPTPKGGGVGVLAAFLAASLFSGQGIFLWLPASILAVMSFVNDLKGISPKLRLLFQFACAALALGGLWGTGEISWMLLLLAPALLFVVASANYYNFMDGINGIAGICGFVAFGSLVVFATMGGGHSALPVMISIVGALIAFLPFNIPRARLFMGDVGSILLGFLFALCVCMLARSWTEFLVLASFLNTFYADEIVTTIERLWRRESLMEPHRRHLYQFLANERRIAHWKVSVGYGLVQMAVILLVLWGSGHGVWGVLAADFAVLAFWAAMHCFLKCYVFRVQKGEA